jgi:hypothetical protein
MAETAGEGSGAPAGVDLAKPAAVSAYLPPPPFASVEPVEDDEVLAHQLVAVLAGPVPPPGPEILTAADPSTSTEAGAPPEPVSSLEPVAPVESAETVTPATEAAEPIGAVEAETPEVDLVDPESGRELTPVERAIRGPRVRSL